MNKEYNGYVVRFFKKGNSVYTKLSNNCGINKISLFEKRGFIIDETSIICRYDKYLDVLSRNRNELKNTVVSEDSIEYFYGFTYGLKSLYVVNLNKSFIDKWSNYDAVNLIKYYVNTRNDKDKNTVYEDTLVNTGWVDFGVSKDITKEEVKKITKGREHTGIYKDAMRVLNHRKLKYADKIEMLESVKAYEEKIDGYLKDCRYKILETAAIDYLGLYSYNKLRELLKVKYDGCEVEADFIEKLLLGCDSQDFDSGFLYFKPVDENMKEQLVNVSELDETRYKTYLNLDVELWSGQSTTIKKYIGKAAVKILKEEYGEDIDYITKLD